MLKVSIFQQDFNATGGQGHDFFISATTTGALKRTVRVGDVLRRNYDSGAFAFRTGNRNLKSRDLPGPVD